MLLRKTRAEAAEPVIKELFACYPTLVSLAEADPEDLTKMLRPIGLHRIRAEAIKRVARTLVDDHGGKVPCDLETLQALPHVGRYAANAVLCFAFGLPTPIVDSNVVRLFNRLFGTERPVEVHKADGLWDFAKKLLPKDKPREFNWALLDLAATVCTPRKPTCAICPVVRYCKAHRTGECGCQA